MSLTWTATALYSDGDAFRVTRERAGWVAAMWDGRSYRALATGLASAREAQDACAKYLSEWAAKPANDVGF
jgi:hypothetical protein